MPDSKITALTSISTSTDPANDPLVIVDLSDTSMAATGTTKKVTLNQLLGASGTATLASATISGNLTVDTNTLFVDSANNRVGIGTASPSFPLDATGGFSNLIARFLRIGDYGEIIRIGRSGVSETASINYPSDGTFAINTLSSQRFSIDGSGVCAWSNVGGVAGTAMTLNATGLGVGVVPSAARFEVGGGDGTQFYIRSTGTNPARIRGFTNSVEAGLIGFLNGGGIYFDVNGERMRIDSSGNVGIGVAPSAWRSTNKAVQVGSYSSLTSSSAGDLQLFNNAYIDSGGANIYQNNGFATRYEQYQGVHAWYTAPSGTANNPISGANAFVQAMTLDASGNLLVGKTASDSTVVGAELRPSGAIISTLAASTNADFALYTYSTGAGAARFYVGMSGTVFATNTTISAISDQRLKENVQDIDVGLGAILALKPRKFDWKEGKGKDIKGDRGFIAQEFEQVFPQLVDEWADPAPEGEAPYKSVRQDLIPVLVKAIQELTARVQTLEAK